MAKNIFEIDPSKPFEHLARNGTRMTAQRCDLQGGYDLHCDDDLSDERLASDVAEIFCWYSANILPNLPPGHGWNLPQVNRILRD